MNVFIINEVDKTLLNTHPHKLERRCGGTPATVKKLKLAKLTVNVESGAGELAGYADQDYEQAGASIVEREAGLQQADIVLYVTRPRNEDISHLKAGSVVIGHIDPFFQKTLVTELQEKGVTVISVEMVPRTTRSQKMDALSSQTNLAGYVMVLNAAQQSSSILPMMMTPAGTVKPAKVFIIGAGVAGLQAIATAKRLGASVTAFDTRPVVAEQVRSLGAKFLDIDLGDTGQNEQGYANELTPEQVQKQKEGQHQAIAEADIVITTAQLFGRKPPVIVTKEDVAAMRPGSVVVDMAAENGGNVDGSKPGEIVDVGGVTIVGSGNWANQVPRDATDLYANNLFNLLDDYIDNEQGVFNLDLSDDILDGCVVVHDGTLRNDMLVNHYSKQQEA
ncbi:MAG: NAD(P) transhydrogenase subunit alpha [Aestuariibacter sp.]